MKTTAEGARGGAQPERIDISSARELDKWSRRLDVSHDCLREAVRAVGSRAMDIEWHLRAGRSGASALRKTSASA
ncbi:hypothetical protein H6CHR_00443 [Variovorax sp. PBL-H6]|uniref:DUF3606 domain-containing protein n=1 Tax=Variovorax sp. PBL-H6 TaxID=434009 RepID=UPI001316DD9D|nr:DUF3606 domain-containing protein [Variovorax sp. PBL-H6]VTU16129.1 hypothetical protein H6CHR_00443 [Variovorax sp. PBL-H6]